MDIFCIELGVLLDSPNTKTLEEPENHSFHCLLDVGACRNSGFVVLGEKDPESSLHCLGLRLEETSTVVAAGRAAGSAERSGTHFTCKTCSGDASKPVAGYRATVKGTVKELGDGSDGVTGQPLLNNIEMLDFEVGCEEEDLVTVKNIGGECQVVSTRTTSSSSTSTPSVASSIPPTFTTMQEETTSSPSFPPSVSLSISPTFAPTFGSSTPSNKPSVESPPDCTMQFCERTLSDDYLLRYRVNVEDASITMEAIYDGEAWIAVAFSEDDMMPGSDAVM